jgi:thioredoxin-related protein
MRNSILTKFSPPIKQLIAFAIIVFAIVLIKNYTLYVLLDIVPYFATANLSFILLIMVPLLYLLNEKYHGKISKVILGIAIFEGIIICYNIIEEKTSSHIDFIDTVKYLSLFSYLLIISIVALLQLKLKNRHLSLAIILISVFIAYFAESSPVIRNPIEQNPIKLILPPKLNLRSESTGDTIIDLQGNPIKSLIMLTFINCQVCADLKKDIEPTIRSKAYPLIRINTFDSAEKIKEHRTKHPEYGDDFKLVTTNTPQFVDSFNGAPVLIFQEKGKVVKCMHGYGSYMQKELIKEINAFFKQQ